MTAGASSGSFVTADEDLPYGVYRGFDDITKNSVRDAAESFIRSNLDSPIKLDSGSLEEVVGTNPIGLKEGDPYYDARLDPNSENFSSKEWVRNLAKIRESDREYFKPHKLGCCWQNLSAVGGSADLSYQSTFGNIPFKAAGWMFRHMRRSRKLDSFQILKPMDGNVSPGELLVVLGRPGSGCTTLLKSISSNTHGFGICKDSIISYNGITPSEVKKCFRGEVVYNAETDIHIPNISVYQTLLTVARLKTPQNRIRGVDRESWANHMAEVAMATYGLTHTRNTKVGGDLVRGVSGGERKRVSIAEVTICGSKFQCWDNATRGLDSATALEFVKALRAQAEIDESAACVAIYQCSQDAYDLFDKVCVMYGGYQIYFGPSKDAKRFFEKMGYYCPSRQTTPDFLTSVTSPAERIINKEYAERGLFVPQTAEEMSDYWRSSREYEELQQVIGQQLNHNHEESLDLLRNSRKAAQSKRVRTSSPYTVNYIMQVKYVMIRNFWRIVNSPGVTLIRFFGNIVMALVLGSMFYKVEKHTTTDTFYFRGAAMFYSILVNGFSSLLEIFALFEARPVTEKHKTYSLYHPSADALASVIADIPAKVLSSICFSVIFYFLVNFRRDPGRFFFYLLINVVVSFVMSHLFRCVGALSKTVVTAMVPASVLLLCVMLYTGFSIPKKSMHGWSKWIWYIDPLSYLFESLMTNEFHNRKFPCATYIPNGPQYQNNTGEQKVCSVVGSVPGQDYVLGDNYIKQSYEYEIQHKWRGFGVGMAYVVFFFFLYLFICEYNEAAKQKGDLLVFPRTVVKRMRQRNALKQPSSDSEDIEKSSALLANDATNKTLIMDSSESSLDEQIKTISLRQSDSVVHWRDLSYDVHIKKENKRILKNIDGWVKPGTLTALMGSSGAGKTTLLDCLAERVTTGVITGDIFVNGKRRDASFPRSIGYCQQQDLHLKTATVRESLLFSAMLRQPKHVSVQEKKDYVSSIIDVLEMESYADAVVGVAGEGLNVEQRKRLTIGVELAAKPKLLLFLDEPTSGLDSQTAWSICQLMRKLVNRGQAILCTIHQPSAILMQEFDRLLFLQKGGETVYFGDLGDECSIMIDYFERNGAHKCPPNANPAEWMLEVVGAAPASHANKDYHEVWKNSKEYQEVQCELDRLETELKDRDDEGDNAEGHKSYATDIFSQILIVSHRFFQQYWRSPQYLWPKLFLTAFNEIFIGFTFFKEKRSLQGLQNQMLSTFVFCVIFNALLQQFLPVYVEQRNLYEARERPSRTFSWFTFIVSQIIVEVPWNFLAGTIAFFVYYYPVGFYQNASEAHQLHERGALYWLFCTAFFVWIGSMAILANSFVEYAAEASNLALLCFAFSLAFNGVLVPPSKMPHFWIFMHRVSPLTYYIDSALSVGMANVDLKCSEYEYVQFKPSVNQTCGQYMDPYIKSQGTGYLANPNSTGQCRFCPLSKTNDYLKSRSSYYSHRWRNYGIFICFIAFNYVAAIFLYWLARVPKGNRVSKKKKG